MTDPELVVHPDAEAVATDVARRLIERLVQIQADGRVPRIALTGGDIADVMHRQVAEQTRADYSHAGASPATAADDRTGNGVDWSRVDFWWGDERYVPAGDEQRNAGQARAALLDHVGVDPARVHEMPAADAGYDDVEAAAAAYQDELSEHGPTDDQPFDIVMLGLGRNGHIASLMPHQGPLDVDDRDVVAVTDSPKPPPVRISLTYPALNRTRETWFIVAGEAKAAPAAQALAGADPHDIPAAGAHGRERTVWFLDEAAAARLP